MLIGDVIRIGLTRKRMKVKDLANMLGVGSTAVSQWLSGNSTPPGDKMIKIIEILDLVDEFFPNSQRCSELITGTCEDKPKRRPRNTYDLETFATMETGDGPKFTLTRRPNLLVIEVDKKIVFRLNNREAENFRKIVNTLVDIQMGVGQIK